MVSTNNQNSASKKLPVNRETSKTSDITEPRVHDPLTQIGNCCEKFADTLGQHMTTRSNQISALLINSSVNSSHSSRPKASEEDEEDSRRKHQTLRNNYFRYKSQMQEQRKVRRESRSE